MLLAQLEQQGWQGRALLLARAAAFQRGVWRQLFAAARPGTRDPEPPMELDPAVAFERKRQRACAKVRQGEFTRARQVLTAAELAPGTEATWVALTDPTKRPPEARFPPPWSCSSTNPSVLSSSQHVQSPAPFARPDGVGRLACPARGLNTAGQRVGAGLRQRYSAVPVRVRSRRGRASSNRARQVGQACKPASRSSSRASTASCRHGVSRPAPFSKASWHGRAKSGARARITGSASAHAAQ